MGQPASMDIFCFRCDIRGNSFAMNCSRHEEYGHNNRGERAGRHENEKHPI